MVRIFLLLTLTMVYVAAEQDWLVDVNVVQEQRLASTRNAKIDFKLEGDRATSKWMRLANNPDGLADLYKGSNKFSVSTERDLGKLESIQLWNRHWGWWRLSHITVTDNGNKHKAKFYYNHWLKKPQIVSLASNASLSTHVCPDKWTSLGYTKVCYQYFTEKLNWQDALSRCEGYPGGTLAVSPNTQLNTEMFLLAQKSHWFFYHWFWVGLRANIFYGFIWSDSTLNDFENWSSYKSDGECVEASTYNGLWYSTDCNSLQPYMCQMDLSPVKGYGGKCFGGKHCRAGLICSGHKCLCEGEKYYKNGECRDSWWVFNASQD